VRLREFGDLKPSNAENVKALGGLKARLDQIINASFLFRAVTRATGAARSLSVCNGASRCQSMNTDRQKGVDKPRDRTEVDNKQRAAVDPRRGGICIKEQREPASLREDTSPYERLQRAR
jgi:hypothetical protein